MIALRRLVKSGAEHVFYGDGQTQAVKTVSKAETLAALILLNAARVVIIAGGWRYPSMKLSRDLTASMHMRELW